MKKAVIAIFITVVFGAGLWLGMVKQRGDQLELLMQDRVVTVLKDPRQLKPFHLLDFNGEPFDLPQLQDKWSLVFFGYTNCPDICPTTLTTLNRLYNELGKKPGNLDDVQFVFVSVDPKRDQGAKLKSYVQYFNKDFIGVTGDAREIANLAAQVGASYEVLERAGDQNYPVNHTAAIFIINKQGQFLGLMSPPLDPAAMASRIELIKQL